MGEFASILYQQFFLRDFLGKIFPGAILVVGFFCSMEPTEEILVNILENPQANHFILIPFYLAGLWLLGIVVQCVGKRFQRTFPFPIGNERAIYFSRRDISRDENLFQERLAEFTTSPNITDFNRRQRERHVVIKEASGNAAIALFLIAIFMMFVNCIWFIDLCVYEDIRSMTNTDLIYFWTKLSFIVPFTIILLCEHKDQRRLQAEYETSVIRIVRRCMTPE